MSKNTVQATHYQAHCMLGFPETTSLVLGGGRAGGKTFGAVLIAVDHANKYGPDAKILFIRESYKAAEELEATLEDLLTGVFPRTKYNKHLHRFEIPNGATVEVGQLAAPPDYRKFQGRSITLLIVDEAGLLPTLKWVRLLQSNLRGPKGVPLRTLYTANPGGAQHGTLYKEFISHTPPWTEFKTEDGQVWAFCPSTVEDNPHIDAEPYLRRLKASVGNDEALFQAWATGDWSALNRGAYFSDVYDPDVHILPAAFPHYPLNPFRPFWAMDWGSASPSVAYLVLDCPGDIGPWPKGSLILLDEVATADPTDPNVGLGWPPSKIAEVVLERCQKWGPGVHPTGVCDDSSGLDESLLATLRRYGLFMNRPIKGRVAGWQLMRQMLHNAREKHGPGLYLTERCKYWIETVPHLQRDAYRPEDIDTNGPDHAGDATRYGCMHKSQRVGQGTNTGLY